MQFTVAILGMAAAIAMALENRQQIGGGLGGTAGDGSATLGGAIGPSGVSGCIGGAEKNDGGSLCYPIPTEAKYKRQELGGGGAGTLGPASATAGGAIGAGGAEGCAGGAFESEGYTFCFPAATPAPKLK